MTFTVTVLTPQASPTGTVDFYETSAPPSSVRVPLKLLASLPLTEGAATFSASTLALGQHTLLAIYSGGANYSASTSPQYVQEVNPYRVYLPGALRP